MVMLAKLKGIDMKKEINAGDITNADHSVDIGNGIIQNLKFFPSQDFTDEEGDVKLFGISVRQQGRKLIIMMKIYEEGRRKEIIDKSGIMAKIMLMAIGNDEIDKIHVVDSKDILDQISKHKIDANKLTKFEKQEQDITVEVIDLITGEMVPVEFSMGLLKIDKKKNINL